MRKSSELKHVNGGKKTCYNFWPLCRLAWGQMKERHGWIISPLPLWRTVNLTVCWTSVILCLGVFPSKTQCLKPISDLQGEKAQNTEQILLLLNGVTVISFFFFFLEYILLFSCCQVWNGNSVMVRNCITLCYRAEQIQYNYVSPVFCLWHMEPLGGTQQLIISLCCHETLHGTYPPKTEIW